jgi:hypothetical protein
VQLDGRASGQIRKGEYVLIRVAPGSHKLELVLPLGLLTRHMSTDIELRAGRTEYVLFSSTGRGAFLAPVPEDIAAKHLSGMREAHL